ncbi:MULTISPECIES: hypothetical protein [unclassified Streptomyces]|uniref:hypothetical protein n=1 Tax=unclassified Streptomyces TaxID=2593676 RepID=UPI002DD9FC54|nr:hypothetical protein [Streptomyces sp. NBC_01750]WSB00720.1 hypothetical protein OIE54_16270 [Streptomyces sp. NBC_01794]WSD34923.1 hypothetical protein OG966_25340 [Streptomyces sp. NBC_01750]
MNKRASIISGVTLALTAGALVLAPGASASAQLGDCNAWKSNRPPYTGSAYCSGMGWSDKFRVKLTCIDPRGSQWLVYGPWKKNAQTSTAKCSDNPNVGIYKVGFAFDH